MNSFKIRNKIWNALLIKNNFYLYYLNCLKHDMEYHDQY